MINSVYGKTMENLRQRIQIQIKYTSRPTHTTHKIFNKNYAAFYEIKPVLTLNKTIYVDSLF